MSGIFGVISRKDILDVLFYGTDYHSHLGTEFAGIATYNNGKFNRQIHNISQSQFKSKFSDDYSKLQGNSGIGVISAIDEQPIYLNSKFGAFCIVTNGFIENADKLSAELLKKGFSFTEVTSSGVNMTELVAKLILQGNNLINGINKMFSKIEGSCSLLILNKDGVIAARDRRGYTPLVIGKRDNYTYAVTSETSAFPNTGFEVAKYLGPGEIVLLNEKGIVSKQKENKVNQICSFFWIYTGFPASNYEGINTEIVREKCGRYLAKRDKDIKIDLVAGVPDSGLAHAQGYAMESGKPFRRPLVKYTPGYGRSYTPPSQKIRDLVATMKLIPIKEVIKGNRIVICEDSIVRGTQLKNFTVKKLWDAGAKEIHVRPACPPLMYPCKYNISTRSASELVARRAICDIEKKDIKDISKYIDHTARHYQKMVDWIRKDIEVTSLRYQYIEDMIAAIGLPKEKLCLYCWTGK